MKKDTHGSYRPCPLEIAGIGDAHLVRGDLGLARMYTGIADQFKFFVTGHLC